MMKTVLHLLDESLRGGSLSEEVWLVCRPLKSWHCGVKERVRLFLGNVHGGGRDYDAKEMHASRRRRDEEAFEVKIRHES
jgi:hypothetical protein